MKRTFLCGLLAVAIAYSCAPGTDEGTPSGPKRFTIATVVKLEGDTWFARMREGVERFRRDTGHECFQQGPAKADAALQVQIIEDLIAQSVDAICVVPFAVEALEPVLKKARERKIIVVSHEASNQINADAIIEAFDNHAYGAHLMDHLARFMGGEGQFATFVGGLTSRSHMEWIDGALVRQKEEYPKLEQVAERIEDYDDQNLAYEKTKELLTTYPNLRGIQGSASTTAAGAGLAVEERGLQGRVMVVGTSLVAQTRPYLVSGSVKLISFWDPADAGYAMNRIAEMLLEGKTLTHGTSLGIAGYQSLKQDPVKINLFYGNAWVDVTKENMDDYDF